jgi:hypothetical protein
MPSLQSAAGRWESLLQTVAGSEFLGTIFPADEGSVPSLDFTTPRHLMRVAIDSLVQTKDIIVDAFGRRFLVADHDSFGWRNERNYRVHRLFTITDDVSWQRARMYQDTLTGLDRVDGMEELGPLACVLEQSGREQTELTLRVAEDKRRLITGAAVQLDDRVDGSVVKRIQPTLGIFLVEVQ